MALKRTAGLVLLAWEIWWVYAYVSAPRPDEKMITVVAFFLGGVLPAAIVVLATAIVLIQRLLGGPASNG